jgi:hypothetical protein
MPGFGFTVTETLSLVKLDAVAFTVVVHGSVADPPYVTAAVADVRPVGMVTEAIAAQPGTPAANDTGIPGAGAATGLPALCNSTVTVLGNDGLI